jgi:hypothetical protein
MTRQIRLTATVITGIAILAATWLFVGPRVLKFNELDNKSEWSVLQYVEQKNRDLGSGSRLMFEQSEAIAPYRTVGVREDPTKQWIWILLNPKQAPFYKQLPREATVAISRIDFDRIVKDGDPHPEVQEHLRKMTRP